MLFSGDLRAVPLISRIGLVASVPRPRTIYNQSTYIPEVSSALQHIMILLDIFREMTKYGRPDSPKRRNVAAE
jgi:hypothetical protein